MRLGVCGSLLLVLACDRSETAAPVHDKMTPTVVHGDPCPLVHYPMGDEWPACPAELLLGRDEAMLTPGKPCGESLAEGRDEGATWTYQRDREGRLMASEYTGKAQVLARTSYSYDGAGRLVESTRTGMYGGKTTYERDTHGRLARQTSGDSITTWTRDDDGKPIAIEHVQGKHSEREVISYADGLPTSSILTTTTADGRTWQTTTVLERDASGRRWRSTKTRTYSDNNRETVTVTFTYDGTGRLASLKRIEESKSTHTPEQVTTFTYDDARRVISTKSGGLLRRYTYDCSR